MWIKWWNRINGYFAPCWVWIWEVVEIWQIISSSWSVFITKENKGTGRRLQKTSKSLILFLSIGFLQGRSQSAQGFAVQKSADSRHETVSVDVFPTETVLQDPVERWNTPQYQLLCLVHRGWQDYVTLHNIKLLCPAHGGWPNYVTLTSCSNKELVFQKGLRVKCKVMQAHSVEVHQVSHSLTTLHGVSYPIALGVFVFN